MVLDPGPETRDGEERGEGPPPDLVPVFRHPRWMVGVVLIFGVMFFVMGLANPVWFLIGSPCILVLAIWLWVRVIARR